MYDVSTESSVLCAICDERVPRGHTVLRADQGRICWFCHTDENVDPDSEWDDDDDDEWDDWDDGWDD